MVEVSEVVKSAFPFQLYTVHLVVAFMSEGRMELLRSSKGADLDEVVRPVGIFGTARL